MDNKTFTREELMQICKDAVVSFDKWGDRDSYIAQRQISTIHGLLAAGVAFVIDEVDDRYIDITFTIPTDEQKSAAIANELPIDDRMAYLEANDYDEMFDGKGIDYLHSDYLSGWMPTRQRLDHVAGGDWC